MRTIELDMSLSCCDDIKRAGQRGEHRMTQLVIPLPPETAHIIKSCVVLMQLDSAPPVVSQLVERGASGDAYIKGRAVFFVLQQHMTFCRCLRVQLECYDANGKFIDRSAVSERILFSPALADDLADLQEAQNSPSAISELLARWPILRRIGAAADLPTWDNAPWPGGGTIELTTPSYEWALQILNE